jgi:uncharacterized protein (DUF342 family)
MTLTKDQKDLLIEIAESLKQVAEGKTKPFRKKKTIEKEELLKILKEKKVLARIEKAIDDFNKGKCTPFKRVKKSKKEHKKEKWLFYPKIKKKYLEE